MKQFVLGFALLLAVGVAPAFAQGKFSGYMFGDYSYNVTRPGNITSLSNVASPAGTTAYQEFKLRRIYFAYDDEISETFSSRLRLEADQSSNTSDGKIGFAIKDAFLRWKNIFNGSDLYFGIQPTPTFDVSEGAWGYRSIEKTIMDLRGIAPSRDLGVALRGKVTGDGMVNYWVLIANGPGNKPETDKYKRYYGHLQFKPTAEMQFTVYADFADRADVADPYSAGKKVSNGTLTAAVFGNYAVKNSFNVGLEAYTQSTSHGYDNGTSLASKSGLGLSVFGSVTVMPDVALVGRYDHFDPNTDSNAKYDAREYVVAGLSWKVDKNVAVQPNVLYETYQAPAAGRGAPDPSVTARVTLFYTFL